MIDAGSPPSADERIIGPHLPLAGGLLRAADRAREIGATGIQIFTDNPTAWRRRPAPPPDVDEFRARLAQFGIGPVAVHGPYLVNLAGADEAFRERSIATLVHDLQAAARYGAHYLNIHVGSHGGLGPEAGTTRLAESTARLLAEVPAVTGDGLATPMLVLENSAGSGAGLGSTLEEMAEIVEAIARTDVPLDRIGVCLDTAHLWAAGYELEQPEDIDRLAARAAALLGRERLAMLHLNDARTERGSRIDRHEHIGAGRIGPAVLRRLLEHPWLGRLPTYLETPGMDLGYDAVNMDRARKLANGDELPDLPAEAFSTRGSRSRSAPPPSDAS